MVVIYIILFGSLILNFFVVIFDILPILKPILKNKLNFNKINNPPSIENIEKLLIDRAFKILQNNEVLTVWEEPKGIGEKISYLIFKKNSLNITNYNFPKALLYFGLLKNVSKKDNKEEVLALKNLFDKNLNENGKPTFTLDKVDQVIFANTAIELYIIFKEEKYLKFSDYVYDYLEKIYDTNDGIIKYRKNSKYIIYDTLGMIIPFLVDYHKIVKNHKALKIAKEQMLLYINLGIDKETFVPVHGVDLNTNIKMGSCNWSRGIGWYILGIRSLFEYDNSFEYEYEKLISILDKHKIGINLWPQFVGNSNSVDLSASSMFLSSFPLNYTTKDEILRAIQKFVDKKGYILNTSGDTYGLNRYSQTFGKSELSQGLILLALSRFK